MAHLPEIPNEMDFQRVSVTSLHGVIVYKSCG